MTAATQLCARECRTWTLDSTSHHTNAARLMANAAVRIGRRTT
jgi:hypothetical protein